MSLLHVAVIVYFDVLHLLTEKKKPPEVINNGFKNLPKFTGK